MNIITSIIYAIIAFQKKNDLMDEIKNKNYNKITDNNIIAEFEIIEDNENIRIINSFEEARKTDNNLINEEKNQNEKEIK